VLLLVFAGPESVVETGPADGVLLSRIFDGLSLVFGGEHVDTGEHLVLHHPQTKHICLLLGQSLLDLWGHLERGAHKRFVGIALAVDDVDEVEINQFNLDLEVQAVERVYFLGVVGEEVVVADYKIVAFYVSVEQIHVPEFAHYVDGLLHNVLGGSLAETTGVERMGEFTQICACREFHQYVEERVPLVDAIGDEYDGGGLFADGADGFDERGLLLGVVVVEDGRHVYAFDHPLELVLLVLDLVDRAHAPVGQLRHVRVPLAEQFEVGLHRTYFVLSPQFRLDQIVRYILFHDLGTLSLYLQL